MSVPLPDYCCAVIEDDRGRLLLQLRPTEARFAPGQLTCFGGRRERDEEPLTCLLRELAEELSWQPESAQPCCQLWRGQHLVAIFYRVIGYPDLAMCDEPGFTAIWASWRTLPALPVSEWHRLVLAAIADGRERADLTHPASS